MSYVAETRHGKFIIRNSIIVPTNMFNRPQKSILLGNVEQYPCYHGAIGQSLVHQPQ